MSSRADGVGRPAQGAATVGEGRFVYAAGTASPPSGGELERHEHAVLLREWGGSRDLLGRP